MCIKLFIYNNKQPETSYELYSFKFQAMLSNDGLLKDNNMAYRNSTQFQNWKVLKYKTFNYIVFINTPLTSQYSGTLLLRRLGYYLTLFLLFLLLPSYICEFSNSYALKKTIWLFWILTMQYWGSLLGRALTKDYTIDL